LQLGTYKPTLVAVTWFDGSLSTRLLALLLASFNAYPSLRGMNSIFDRHNLHHITLLFFYYLCSVRLVDHGSSLWRSKCYRSCRVNRSIVKICVKYLNNIKNARQEIQLFQEKIIDLAQALQSLDDLIRGCNGNPLTTTQDLAKNIVKCSSALKRLKEKIDPEMTQKGMKKWGLRAFKWPLTRSEVDDAMGELDEYKATFTFSLVVDRTQAPVHNLTS